MRISDWSSDVCSSDLGAAERQGSLPPAFLLADARYHSRSAVGASASAGVEQGMTIISPFASSEVEMPIGSAPPHGVSTSAFWPKFILRACKAVEGLDTNGD